MIVTAIAGLMQAALFSTEPEFVTIGFFVDPGWQG